MHNEFLQRLGQIADIYLLARLKDDRLGYPFPRDLRVFIPDLHLISQYRQQEYGYKYNTNYNAHESDLLPTMVKLLIEMKRQIGEENNGTDDEDKKKTFEVYQLGDFLDLWRETTTPWRTRPGEWRGYVNRIIESNAALYDALLDETLHTNFILGNHDFDLHRIPEFSHRWRFLSSYLVDRQEVPVVGILHGDLFSWVERLPDELQRFFVHHLSPQIPEEIRKQIIKSHIQSNFLIFKTYKKYKDYIMLKEAVEFHELPLSRGLPPGSEYNVKRAPGGSKEELMYLADAKKYFSGVNQSEKFKVGMAVIGHTHYPRIAVDDSGGEFFALMDCGAWVNFHMAVIEEEGEVKRIPMDNALVGVLCDNDIRLYQLSAKTQ
jgi:UDP-2,3-diacylglucosamine pyrophosphatase LpxH